MDVWVKRELDEGAFPDQRLKTRLGKLLGVLGRRIGATMRWDASVARRPRPPIASSPCS